MEKPQSKKFRIKAGNRLLLFNAPADFFETMGSLPDEVKVAKNEQPDQVHWFVKTRAEVRSQWKEVFKKLGDETILWTYFPKGSSGIQTDLTRDKGWDEMMKADLQWLNLVSFDQTWSAFAMKRKSVRTKQISRKTESTFPEYIDPVKRTVKIPADLADAFSKNAKLKVRFESLAFTHKKEYVQWILSAKKEDTRKNRIKGTIERLEKDLKNPSQKAL